MLDIYGYLDTDRKFLVLSWHQSQQRIQIFSVIRNITFLAGQPVFPLGE